MARIPLIRSRQDLPPDALPAYDAIAASRGSVSGPFEVLLHSPEMAQGIADLGAYVRFRSVLPGRVRELTVISVGRELDALYVWASHVDLARKEGVPEGTIQALREGKAPEGIAAEDAEVISFVQQLLREHRVAAGLFESLRERLGHRGVLELAGTAGYYSMMAAALNTFEVEPEPGMEPLPVPGVGG